MCAWTFRQRSSRYSDNKAGEHRVYPRLPGHRSFEFGTVFVRTSAVILLVTGAVKLISSLGEARILQQSDPLIWFLTERQMLALAAGMELVIVVALSSERLDETSKLLTIAWLGSMFLLYRVGLWTIGFAGACSCLGNAAAWLHVSPVAVERIMGGLLLFLLLGSYGLLAGRIRRWRRNESEDPPRRESDAVAS